MKASDFDKSWYNKDITNMINARKKFFEGDRDKLTWYMEIESKRGDHLGWANVYHREDDPHLTEIGINIVEDNFRRKGMGREAFVLWVEYLFKNKEFTRIGFETWSGIRKRLEKELICNELKGRIRYFITKYRKANDDEARFAILLGGKEILRADIHNFYKGFNPKVQQQREK